MFHDEANKDCFTVCFFISPDLDGNQGTKNETLDFRLCLFISPEMKWFTKWTSTGLHDMFLMYGKSRW
jgi:hypothetical protein